MFETQNLALHNHFSSSPPIDLKYLPELSQSNGDEKVKPQQMTISIT
jgi:hypothetical protein